MSKRSKRSMQEETFFNGTRKDEIHQPGKRLFALRIYKAAMDNNKGTSVHPIPLPFMDELNDTYGNTPITSKSRSINFCAENLFPDSSTIPLPTSPNKPSTSSAFTFQGSPRTLDNVVLTDSESTSAETSDDELASVSSADSPKTQKRTITSSDYYRERLNQLEREQQDRRERWKKKLEIMEKFLNKQI